MVVLRGHSRDELAEACTEARNASRSGACLIEEFVEGQLFSHSAFIRNGQIIADFIVREDCTTNPFTVDTSRVEYDFPSAMRESLRSAVFRMASHLQLVDGLVHTQFITNGTKHWLIEVTRRCPGDLYALLIEMSTGYPYGAAYAAPFVGKEAPEQGAGGLRNRIIRHTATSRDGESLWGFHFTQPVDIKFFLPLAVAGEFIKPSPYGRAGLFFLGAKSDVEEKEIYQSLLERSLYRYNL
jgi:carbamoylphosphate synthase large subunit